MSASPSRPLAKTMLGVFVMTLVIGLLILAAVLVGIPPEVAGGVGAVLSIPVYRWAWR